MANPQHTLVLHATLDGALCVAEGQTQRFFAEHMLASLDRMDNLVGVLQVRRAKNDRLKFRHF